MISELNRFWSDTQKNNNILLWLLPLQILNYSVFMFCFLVFLLFVLKIIDMNRKAFISPVFFPLIYFHTSPCFHVSLCLSPLFFVCLSGLRSRCPPAPSLGAGMTSSHRCLVLRVPIHHPDHHRRHQQHHLRTHAGTHTHTDCMQIKGEVRKWTPIPRSTGLQA